MLVSGRQWALYFGNALSQGMVSATMFAPSVLPAPMVLATANALHVLEAPTLPLSVSETPVVALNVLQERSVPQGHLLWLRV